MAYTHKYLQRILVEVIDKTIKEIKEKGVSGVEDNYKDGVGCESFLIRRIKSRTSSCVIGRPKASRTKCDFLILENKRDGIRLHTVQVKSSEKSPDHIVKLGDEFKEDMWAQTILFKQNIAKHKVKVLSMSSWYVGVFNKKRESKQVVSVERLKGKGGSIKSMLVENNRK